MGPDDISQTYHANHKALDITPDDRKIFYGYGTPLTAPEEVRIIRITGDTYTPDSTKNLQRGYGVWMKGLETGFTHLYWHVLPYLPVWGGDIVKRGKIVAFMGNAGLVYRGGVYVPLEDRTDPDFPGLHLHWETFDPTFRMGDAKAGHEVNQIPLLDYSLQPTYTTLDHLLAYGVVVKKWRKLGLV